MEEGKRRTPLNNVYFIDRYGDNQRAGRVIGSQNAAGITRKGVDQENIIGIDNDALRIEPLRTNGWEKCGIVYGPYQRENGLMMAVSLLNGHNTSQADSLNQPFKRRILDWILGNRTSSPPVRLLKWLRYGRKKRTIRMWRRWLAIQRQITSGRYDTYDENLAVGWFAEEVPEDPRQEGNAFVVHATGPENGELWARINDNLPPLIRGLQNIPLYYIIVLRERGAAYYAAAVPETSYLPAHPYMRPLGIDTRNQETAVYAGLHQSVMGQSGFWADTLVREIQVDKAAALDSWYGTAETADKLRGKGALAGSRAETGHIWQGLSGRLERTSQGCRSIEQENMALVLPDSPVGLIHLFAQIGDVLPESLSFIWRYQDSENFWAWELRKDASELSYYLNGKQTVVATDEQTLLESHSSHSLQLLDDGRTVRLLLDGKPVCGLVNTAEFIPQGLGVALRSCGANDDFYFCDLEIHPRQIQMPEEVSFRPLWKHSLERHIVAHDDFSGPAEQLDGRTIPASKHTWQRILGSGSIELTGAGTAVVKATAAQPNPGRTLYTIPWQSGKFADLEIEFIAPGNRPSTEEKSRIGFVFFQDEKNYITSSTYLDLQYGGSSFAIFYHLGGNEELYDANWSNIGRTVNWGATTRARVIMDGVNVAVLLNGEAVLYRSLTDVFPDIHAFTIRRVGIVVNWEWGNDTGTQLNEFIAADRI